MADGGAKGALSKVRPVTGAGSAATSEALASLQSQLAARDAEIHALKGAQDKLRFETDQANKQAEALQRSLQQVGSIGCWLVYAHSQNE